MSQWSSREWDWSPDAEDRRRALLEAYASVFTQTDRILTGDANLRVKLYQADHIPPNLQQVPGWTNGRIIGLNEDEILKDVTSAVDHMVSLLGLNYHEVGHVLVTPRPGSTVARAVALRGDNHWHAFNILEDQRAESFMVAMFRHLSTNFTAAVLRWLANDEDGMETNYPLIHGRRYLPRDLRDAFRAKFRQPELLDDFADVIDQYRKLVVAQQSQQDADQVLVHVERFLSIMNQMPKEQQLKIPIFMHVLPNEVMPEPKDQPSTPAKAWTHSKQRRVAQQIEQDTKEQDDGEAKQRGTGNAGGAKTKEPGSDASEGRDDQGADDQGQTSALDVERAIADALDQIKRDAQAQQQADLTNQAVQQSVNTQRLRQPDTRFTLRRAQPEHNTAVNRIAASARRVMVDLEPEYHRRQSDGFPDFGALIDAEPGDLDIFTRWDEGREEDGRLEVVGLLDRSTSMSMDMTEASAALWVLKRAMDETPGASMATYGFSDQYTVLYRRDEHAERGLYRDYVVQGGTNPVDALQQAREQFYRSTHPNRLLFIVTDGEFNPLDTAPADGIIASIPALRVLIGLNERSIKSKHKCDLVAVATSPIDIVVIVEKAIGMLLDKIARELTGGQW